MIDQSRCVGTSRFSWTAAILAAFLLAMAGCSSTTNSSQAMGRGFATSKPLSSNSSWNPFQQEEQKPRTPAEWIAQPRPPQ